IVLQVYDEQLSGAHRVSLGSPGTIAVDQATGYGLVSLGPLPQAGSWWRLRVPLADIGMDGRRIAGLAFLTDGGHMAFGPTRLSGAEDDSPRLARADARDTGG